MVLLRNLLLSREPLYGVPQWAARCDRTALGLAPQQIAALNQPESTASGGETPTGSAVAGVNLGRSSARKVPWGRRTAHEGLAEPGPREVGLQVPRRDPPEVPSQGVVREDAPRRRPDPAGPVPAEGSRAGGGEGNAGPHPHAAERAAAIQSRDGDRLPEGQECDPDPPGAVAHEG